MFDKESLKILAFGLGLMVELITLVLAGLLVGLAIDKYFFSSQKWGTLIFALLGLVLGFYKIYKKYGQYLKQK